MLYSLKAVDAEPLDSPAVRLRRRLLRRGSYLARAVYGGGRCQGVLVVYTRFCGGCGGGDAIHPACSSCVAMAPERRGTSSSSKQQMERPMDV